MTSTPPKEHLTMSIGMYTFTKICFTFRSSSLQPAPSTQAQPVKTDLNKKLDGKQKTFQTFNIDAQQFKKTKTENPLAWEIGVTS